MTKAALARRFGRVSWFSGEGRVSKFGCEEVSLVWGSGGGLAGLGMRKTTRTRKRRKERGRMRGREEGKKRRIRRRHTGIPFEMRSDSRKRGCFRVGCMCEG
jgi:hypothetical protein